MSADWSPRPFLLAAIGGSLLAVAMTGCATTNPGSPSTPPALIARSGLPGWGAGRMIRNDGPLDKFGDVLTRMKTDECSGKPFCLPDAWITLADTLRDLPAADQMSVVQQIINRVPYVADVDRWKVEDYWATPREFFNGGGDCEDFVIAKFAMLRYLGFPEDALRMVIVKTPRGPHALMSVRIGNHVTILDNGPNANFNPAAEPNFTALFETTATAWWWNKEDETQAGRAQPPAPR